MKKVSSFAALTSVLLSGVSAIAQAPAPAQMGITPNTTPEVLQVLDNSRTWVPLGTVDSVGHSFRVYGAAGTDVRSYGCYADGSTDQAACLNYASTNAPDCALVPASVAGFYVAPGSTVNVGKCLRGTVFNPGYSTPYPGVFSGQSWIKCGTQANSVCVKSTRDGAFIGGLTIATAFPPALGSIGLEIAGGFNSQLRDANVSGFDQCAYWLGGSANPGISSRAIGLYMSWCQTHSVVDDGWPELYVIDGRWGSNAQGATAVTPKDAIYITKSTDSGAGGGPNSLTVIGAQVNPGGGYIECMVRWGGWVGAGGGKRQYKFIGNHWEYLAPAPSNPTKKGIFCTDSTVPLLAQLYVTNSEFNFDAVGGGHVFDFDPATRVENIFITGSQLAADDTTIAFVNGGTQATASAFTGSFFGGPTHFTGSSDGSSRLASSGNIYGSTVTLDGSWGSFSSFGDQIGTLVDTATGSVAWGNAKGFSFTPTLLLNGGAATGWSYTASGFIARTGTGGFKGYAKISVTVVGSATGQVSVGGVPIGCVGSGPYALTLPPMAQTNFTGLTGALMAQLGTGSNEPIFIQQSTATGASVIQSTNLTATTNFSVPFECLKAL